MPACIWYGFRTLFHLLPSLGLWHVVRYHPLSPPPHRPLTCGIAAATTYCLLLLLLVLLPLLLLLILLLLLVEVSGTGTGYWVLGTGYCWVAAIDNVAIDYQVVGGLLYVLLRFGDCDCG